jgi:hypothetical protein
MTVVSSVAASRIQSAIASASSRTGIAFDYLLGQAKLESGLNPTARAGTSTATGLYQFIEQSWLGVVKKHGAEHGLGWAAASIGRTASGRFTVGDPATRQAILQLRNDPEVASLMAAAHAGDNKAALEGTLGREATGTDLYMAHFLGLGGARKFLTRMAADPDASGAALFPDAAAANRNVFYDRSGAPRSLSEIYAKFGAKLGQGATEAGRSAVHYAAQALNLEGSTVVTGAGESASDALAWASTTLGRLGRQTTQTAASVLRPTPDTARLAYLMLAGLGGR